MGERMLLSKSTNNVSMARRPRSGDVSLVLRLISYHSCWMMMSIIVLLLMVSSNAVHGFALLARSSVSATTTATNQKPSLPHRGVSGGGDTSQRQNTPHTVILSSSSSLSSTATSLDTTSSSLSLLSSNLSWDDLAVKLKDITKQNKEGEKEEDPVPVLTLYRDTNGWCPFCERVWLALEVKGIPYRERLINLRDKPDWYKDLVPTTLVPAILLHKDEIINNENNNNDHNKNTQQTRSSLSQRQIVWESLEIMQVLDDAFPETQRLVWNDNPNYQAAMEQITTLASAGFKFIYSNRNQTLTDSERLQLKQKFLNELDRLDVLLSKTKDSGPFLMGANFSAADACLIPTMERWRYQLAPPLNDIILESDDRPHVAQWFQAMDELPAYANRVAGDCYSWTAVASTFARYFGGEEQDESVQRMIQTADAAAAKLRSGFSGSVTDHSWKDGIISVVEAAQQAAHKLINNHEAVVVDCTRVEPISQKELERAAVENLEAVNAILLQVAHVLIRIAASDANNDDNASSSSWMTMAQTEPMLVNIVSPTERAEAAKAARTVAARLCVPRDIGAPAAKILRGVLSITANRVEQLQHHQE